MMLFLSGSACVKPTPVVLVQVLHEVPPLRQEGLQSPPGAEVLLVLLEVCRELRDARRQAGDLHLGGASVCAMSAELVHFAQVCATPLVPSTANPPELLVWMFHTRTTAASHCGRS